MRTKILTLASLAVILAGCCDTKPAIEKDAEVEKKVSEIVSKMTLEEKVGQMIQINWNILAQPGTTTLSDEGREIIKKYKIGSSLNCITDSAASPELYRAFIQEIQDEADIPVLYGLDQIHGASYIEGTVLFPQEIAVAASFNTDIAYQTGRVAAYETRAAGVPWVFTPTLDLSRNQCWPRIWESFGEDPIVQAKMGVALTKGFQGDDPNHIDSEHVAACIKHYMAYGASV